MSSVQVSIGKCLPWCQAWGQRHGKGENLVLRAQLKILNLGS